MRVQILLTVGLATLVACKDRDARLTDSAAGLAALPSASALACSPAVLRPNDALNIRMPQHHGPTLTAVGPDGTRYLIVFYGQGKPENGSRQSLVPPDSFHGVTEMNLDPKLLTAAVWAAGRDTNEVVFRKAGEYRIQVGSDAEADGPAHTECVVRYAP